MYQAVEIWKTFLSDFLEFTLVFFTYLFYNFFSNFWKFWIQNGRFLILDRTDPAKFQRILKNPAKFLNPAQGSLLL
jgi:hypothetical protein